MDPTSGTPVAAAAPAAPAKSKEKEQAEKERAEREKDFINNVLSTCLDQSARARLSTLALTRPETAQTVQSIIVQMARRGQLPRPGGARLTDDELVKLLESVQAAAPTKTQKVTYQRRTLDDDD